MESKRLRSAGSSSVADDAQPGVSPVIDKRNVLDSPAPLGDDHLRAYVVEAAPQIRVQQASLARRRLCVRPNAMLCEQHYDCCQKKTVSLCIV